jgi:hypothetical protein
VVVVLLVGILVSGRCLHVARWKSGEILWMCGRDND